MPGGIKYFGVEFYEWCYLIFLVEFLEIRLNLASVGIEPAPFRVRLEGEGVGMTGYVAGASWITVENGELTKAFNSRVRLSPSSSP